MTVAAFRPAEAAEPIPGYRLEAVLGRGGFGEVWRAQAPGGFPVALKFLAADEAGSERELRSLQMLQKVRDGHLLGIHGVWAIPGHFLMAMELADGTLMDRLTQSLRRGFLGIPRDDLLDYFQQAARGIDFLNEPRHVLAEGSPPIAIQHGDIKPQNLLLVGSLCKVGDFGLLRQLGGSASQRTGSMTVAYAPPEVFDRRPAPQSDQYSLAVTWCQLRGGRLPFEGGPVQVMAGHLHRPPDLTMLPEAERPAVARALSKLPEERWSSCRAFVEALRVAPAGGLAPPSTDPTLQTTPGPTGPDSAPPTPPPASTHSERRVAQEPRPGATEAPSRTVGERCRCLGHTDAATSVAFSPDGRLAVSGGADKAVRLWDVASGRELRRFEGHMDEVWGVAFAPDGRSALSGGSDATVRVWDVEGGKELRRFGGHKVACLALSPCGQRVLTGGSDRTMRLWDVDSGQELRRFEGHRGWVLSARFFSDGRRVLSASGDTTMRVWDAESGKELRRLPGQPHHWVQDLFLSPDGRFVAFGSGNEWKDGEWVTGSDHAVHVRDVQTGQEVCRLEGHTGEVTCVAMSPDGRRVLSGSRDQTLRLWELATGKAVQVFRGHTESILCVAISPDGSLALSAAADNTVAVWSLT